jgi:hypothetical protein
MTGTNRTSTPTVPDNTATFTNSSVVAPVQMRSIARADTGTDGKQHCKRNNSAHWRSNQVAPALHGSPPTTPIFVVATHTPLGRDGASMQIISSVDSSLRVSIENKPDLWDFGHCDGVSTG